MRAALLLVVLLGAVGTQAVWCPTTMGTAWSCTQNCDCSPNTFKNTCDTNTGKCVAGPITPPNPPVPVCAPGEGPCSTAGGAIQTCKCTLANSACANTLDPLDNNFNTCMVKCGFNNLCDGTCFCASPYACDAGSGTCTLPKCADNPTLQCGTTAGKCSCADDETCVYDSTLRKNICKHNCLLDEECTSSCICATPNSCKDIAGTLKKYCKLPTCPAVQNGAVCDVDCSCGINKACDSNDGLCKTACIIGGTCTGCLCPYPNTCDGDGKCRQPTCQDVDHPPSCGSVLGTCKCDPNDDGSFVCVNGQCKAACAIGDTCDNTCACAGTCDSNNKCTRICAADSTIPCTMKDPADWVADFGTDNLCTCTAGNTCVEGGNTCRKVCKAGEKCGTCGCIDPYECRGPVGGTQTCQLPKCSQGDVCGVGATCSCEAPHKCFNGKCAFPCPTGANANLYTCSNTNLAEYCACTGSNQSCSNGKCKAKCSANAKCTDQCACTWPSACQGQTGDLRCKTPYICPNSGAYRCGTDFGECTCGLGLTCNDGTGVCFS